MLEEYNKTLSVLSDEFDKNEVMAEVSKEKARVVHLNQFSHRFPVVSSFSIAPYFFLSLSVLKQSINGQLAALTGAVPVETIPLFIMGGSYGLGYIIKKIVDKKNHLNEKLRSFTDAKTQVDLEIEKVRNKIEMEKATNRKIAIKIAIDSISNEQKALQGLLDRYDFIDKTSLFPIEEIKENVEKLTKKLEEKLQELDILSTQRVLQREFMNERENNLLITKLVRDGSFAGFMFGIYYLTPIMFLEADLSNLPIVGQFMALLAPFIAGAVGAVGYDLKKRKDNEKVLNSFNKELGENAISDRINNHFAEDEETINEIKTKRREIGSILEELEKYKRILEKYNNAERIEEQIETTGPSLR